MIKAAKTALIIADDKNITRTFARILQKRGYETGIAQSGKEAIEKAHAKCYSVALIDVCLPDFNGTDLLDKLDDHGCRMVKIIITCYPTPPPKTGKAADAYLQKPVKPQELFALIEEKTKQD